MFTVKQSNYSALYRFPLNTLCFYLIFQVPLSQSPAVQVESKKLPAASDTIPNESDSADHVGTQVTAK